MDQDDIKEFLKTHLQIKCTGGDFTNPNRRTISLVLDGEEISSASFDVVQQREYGG